ncbi:MAG: hypothetical protein WC829_03785 [Hyphomicrobium sp.]|jgi:hypothetical protein
MDDTGAAFVTLILGILVIGVIIGLIVMAVIAAIVIAMLLAGVISIYMVKSSRGLVVEEDVTEAFGMSLCWAAVLTVGCILGSISLYAVLSSSSPQFAPAVIEKYGGPPEHWKSALLLLDTWLLSGAYVFFIKAALVIFAANRAYVAMQHNAPKWLMLAPPFIAMALFFIVDHWGLVVSMLQGQVTFQELALKAYEIIWLPFHLAHLALTEPEAVVRWALELVQHSEGSLFRLESVYPSIFFVIAMATALNVISSIADAGGS